MSIGRTKNYDKAKYIEAPLYFITFDEGEASQPYLLLHMMLKK
jgi:hypothetical protein